MRSRPLRGWHVLSLRPHGLHDPIQRAVKARGGCSIAVSAVQLEALSADTQLLPALAAPRRIFTSPSAVRFAARHASLMDQPAQITFAVGSGTANALRQRGVQRIQIPDDAMRSEGLLALPLLQAENATTLGFITAPGGRSLLADTLHARGFRIIQSHVYARRALAISNALHRRLNRLRPPVALLISSTEAFDIFWQQQSAANQQKLRQAIAVVASQRIAAHLCNYALKNIRIAANALPQTMLREIV